LKQASCEVEVLFKKVLEQDSYPKSFEFTWNTYQYYLRKVGRKKVRPKRQVAIILIALLTLFVMGSAAFAGIMRKTDNLNYSFINDPQVIGKWESVDFVQKMDDFDPDQKSTKEQLYLTALAFIKEGKILAGTENRQLAYSSFTWTKDKVLNKQEKTASSYILKSINGSTYMFFEWKSGDYIFRNKTPWYYVLKKVNNDDYSNYQVNQIIRDKIDYPFVDDNQVKGKWGSVDFVKSPNDFNPEVTSSLSDLFLTGLVFNDNGKIDLTTTAGNYSGDLLTWTKGLILDKKSKTASKYQIKVINGTSYLFYEWKNGDYIYNGVSPNYYVLKKLNDN